MEREEITGFPWGNHGDFKGKGFRFSFNNGSMNFVRFIGYDYGCIIEGLQCFDQPAFGRICWGDGTTYVGYLNKELKLEGPGVHYGDDEKILKKGVWDGKEWDLACCKE